MTHQTADALRMMRKTFIWFGLLGLLCVLAGLVLGFFTETISESGAVVVMFVGAMGVLAGARGWQLAGRRLEQRVHGDQ